MTGGRIRDRSPAGGQGHACQGHACQGHARSQGHAGTLLLLVIALALVAVLAGALVPRLRASTASVAEARRDLHGRWTARAVVSYILALYRNGELGDRTEVELPGEVNGLRGEGRIQYPAPSPGSRVTLYLADRGHPGQGPPPGKGQRPAQPAWVELPCGATGQVNLEVEAQDGSLLPVKHSSVLWEATGFLDDPAFGPDAHGIWRTPAEGGVTGTLRPRGLRLPDGTEVHFLAAPKVTVTTPKDCSPNPPGVYLFPHGGALAAGQDQRIYGTYVSPQGHLVSLTPGNATATLEPAHGPAELVPEGDHWRLEARAEGAVRVTIEYDEGHGPNRGSAVFYIFPWRALITATAGETVLQVRVESPDRERTVITGVDYLD
ncbi:MAG: hypothetical protein DIU70_004580 [Bacillota bacterium]